MKININDLYEELIKGKDFAKDQAPVIIKQKLSYDFIINLLYVFILFIIGFIILSTNYHILIIIPLIISIFPILNMIKIKNMPNLYIYEYIVNEIKFSK